MIIGNYFYYGSVCDKHSNFLRYPWKNLIVLNAKFMYFCGPGLYVTFLGERCDMRLGSSEDYIEIVPDKKMDFWINNLILK